MYSIEQEVAYRVQQGQRHLSFQAFKEAYAQIGYKFDRSSDCKGIARYMTGERAGVGYPCLSLYPIQIDNGLSAWNVDARRDNNYQAFKVLRNSLFAVIQGRIVEV